MSLWARKEVDCGRNFNKVTRMTIIFFETLRLEVLQGERRHIRTVFRGEEMKVKSEPFGANRTHIIFVDGTFLLDNATFAILL